MSRIGTFVDAHVISMATSKAVVHIEIATFQLVQLEFNPFLVTISKVLNETSKAYQVVGRMNTSDVTSCRCCGKDLTDWRSQATGVGPVCSKYLNIPYVKNVEDVAVFKKMLKLKIEEIGDLTFWVPKSQIVEGLDELSSQTSK